MELFEEFRAMLSQKRMCIVLWSEKNVQAIKRGCRVRWSDRCRSDEHHRDYTDRTQFAQGLIIQLQIKPSRVIAGNRQLDGELIVNLAHTRDGTWSGTPRPFHNPHSRRSVEKESSSRATHRSQVSTSDASWSNIGVGACYGLVTLHCTRHHSLNLRSSQVLERMSWNELSKPLQLGRTLEGRTTARYANCSMTWSQPHQRPGTGVTFQNGEARKLWTSWLLERVCGAGSRDYS